ncbi:MAG: insulinase family protein [Bacteroidales bacterium]|jgi:predicted Zn-dependent peptidase|nr:insulinase family protein [Bacteroidales bacterium]
MKKLLFIVLGVLILFSCGEKSKTKTKTDTNGYNYEYVEGDPAKARIYTLGNGLKIYLSVNKDQPRIQTYIAVRAGSKHDPRETTGLAHYFEHMMFKGTNKIGTLDWEKESLLISQISNLFEQRIATEDPVEKERLYIQIDSISQIASGYAIANEYDKICSLLGATGTNAWTNYEETVYVNEIPSNEIERWLYVERERFENLVLRLFHTELETVFEEFNMGQDTDGRKANSKLMETLFKKHPYGVSVIGKAEHLKNPSMVNILKFKEDYYVPNNIAICLSGDMDMEATVKLIDKYWGTLKPNENIPEFNYEEEEPIVSVSEIEVNGPEREFVTIAYRSPNNKTKESKYLDMIGLILSNDKAGLMDLDLVKKQKVMSAYAYNYGMNDYGTFRMGGTPRENQSLEEVRDLLLEEIEKVKKGEFEDWLLQAIVNEIKLDRTKAIDNNYIAYYFVNSFIAGEKWEDVIFDAEEYEKITKQELVDFANEFFKDNYIVLYKRTGTDNTIVHVEKPKITPLQINRNVESQFIKELREIKVDDIEPVFVDYKKLIKTENIVKDLEYNYIKNESNDLFYLDYIFDMGRKNNEWLSIAINYLKYLGTEDKTIDDLQKEWYRLGVNFNVSVGDDRAYVYINGLDENLEAAMKLMEEILANVKPDQEVYNEYVNGIIKSRLNNKLNKSTILFNGLMSYSKYGEQSLFNDVISEEELRAKDPSELTDLIKDMLNYEHKIFYYGPRESGKVAELVKANHNVGGNYKPVEEPKEFPELDYNEPKVYFANYDMTQTMIAIVSKDVEFDKNIMPEARMFNEYYGGSMSSIVFQEIRESKGLAYGCYAGYSQASESGKSNYVLGYLSTQPDKMKEALDALTGLLNELALSDELFANSKDAIIKQMKTERIIKDDIFWNYYYNKKRGIDYDIRKDIYNEVKDFTLNDVSEFFDSHIAGKKYDILIIGNRDKIDFNLLKPYGQVHELSLEEIFGY